MHLAGIIVGLATFLIIGICHPIVIKAEYHFGKRCWWAFLLAGLAFGTLSVMTEGIVASTILGVAAFSAFWGIPELFMQAKRVEKGWFPENPARKKKKDEKFLEDTEKGLPLQSPFEKISSEQGPEDGID